MMKRLNNLSRRNQIILLLVMTIGIRLTLAWVFGTEVADLVGYHQTAEIVARNGNIYQTASLFPYTPISMFLPAWSLQLAQTLGLPFHFVVKWPIIIGDAGIALLLWWQAQKRNLKNTAILLGLAFAVNPVSLLITSFHGNYMPLTVFFVLLAYCLVSFLPVKNYYSLSALSLGMAIGLRGYPVLFVPFFLRKMNLNWRRKVIFLVLAGLPSVISLLPFMVVNFNIVWREVFSYSGLTDYGWIAAMREYWLITTGNLYLPGTLSENLLNFSKWLFLIAYVLMVVVFWWKHKHFGLLSCIIGTTLLFFCLYGGISSQYLVWVIPFGLLIGSAWETAYTWSATASLITFYLYYFPTILFGELPVSWQELNPSVIPFILFFNIAFWGICLAWLVRIIIHPIEDIAMQTSDIYQPNSVVEKSPNRTRVFASIGQKLAMLAELLLVVYIGLVFVLEINLLVIQTSKSPLQELNVTTVWSVGKSGSGLGEFSSPFGMAVDKTGDIYIADRGNHRVEEFSSDGKAIATWNGDSVNHALFKEPSDIAIDASSGIIWVLDSGNGWIYSLGTDGKMEAVISGANLLMYNPKGLAISPSGDIFVADTGGARILHLDQKGNVIATWGNTGTGSNQFQDPIGINIQNNDLFVVDVNNQRIVHYMLDGKLVGSFNVEEGSVWVDSDGNGHIFVSNAQTKKIAVYDYSGVLVSELTPEKEIPPIDGLAGIVSTRDGYLYAVGSMQLYKFKIEWK
jgi:DNA-binding beta-propeller fold protein YncE